MVGAVESDFLHCIELLILDHLSPLDLAPHVVEVSHFEFVGDTLLVFFTVKNASENFELIDCLEGELENCADHTHALEAFDCFQQFRRTGFDYHFAGIL